MRPRDRNQKRGRILFVLGADREHANQGGLSRTILADEPKDASGGDTKRYLVERHLGSKRARESLDFDHRGKVVDSTELFIMVLLVACCFENRPALIQELDQFVATDIQLHGFDQELVDAFVQDFDFLASSQRGTLIGNKGTSRSGAFRQSRPFRARDKRGRWYWDSQTSFLGQRANGRQFLSGHQTARRDEVLDLVDDLEVDRQPLGKCESARGGYPPVLKAS